MCRRRRLPFGHHFDFIAIPIIKKRLRMDTSKAKQDEQSHDLYPERRLSDSRPEAEPAAVETTEQVRQDEENLPERTKTVFLRLESGIEAKYGR